MKITFETSYNSCQVSDNNVEDVYETFDLVLQALRGFGFSDECVADAVLQKAHEINKDMKNLVI